MYTLYTRNTQSAQCYASRTQSSLHAVQSEYETRRLQYPIVPRRLRQADDFNLERGRVTRLCVEGEEK